MNKDDIARLSNANRFNKEESRILKTINNCKTRKCGKLNLRNASKILKKEQNKKCPQKASNGFNDNNCLDKVYTKSIFSRILRKHTKCSKKKCSKERQTLKTLREQLDLPKRPKPFYSV